LEAVGSVDFLGVVVPCMHAWGVQALSLIETLDKNTQTTNKHAPPQKRYRAGIYTHDDASLEAARAYVAAKQAVLPGVQIVTEVEPVRNYSKAEDYHQMYLSAGRGGQPQDPSKGCTDPIRCYG
jgi:peptide-methionine (S)-S-oxide reductase